MLAKRFGFLALATMLVGASAIGVLASAVHPSSSRQSLLQLAQASNCRRIGSTATDVYDNGTATSPSGTRLAAFTTVTLTGVETGVGDARRVQISTPIAGWVFASRLIMCQGTPTPTPTPSPSPIPSLTVRACGRVSAPEGLILRNTPANVPASDDRYDVHAGDHRPPRPVVLIQGTGVMLSSESRPIGWNQDTRQRIITRIIRPNRNVDGSFAGNQFWLYESGPTGFRSGRNVDLVPCSSVYPGVRPGDQLPIR